MYCDKDRCYGYERIEYRRSDTIFILNQSKSVSLYSRIVNFYRQLFFVDKENKRKHRVNQQTQHVQFKHNLPL